MKKFVYAIAALMMCLSTSVMTSCSDDDDKKASDMKDFIPCTTWASSMEDVDDYMTSLGFDLLTYGTYTDGSHYSYYEPKSTEVYEYYYEFDEPGFLGLRIADVYTSIKNKKNIMNKISKDYKLIDESEEGDQTYLSNDEKTALFVSLEVDEDDETFTYYAFTFFEVNYLLADARDYSEIPAKVKAFRAARKAIVKETVE